MVKILSPPASSLNPPTDSLRLFVNRMLLTETAIFFELELIRSVALILRG